MDLINATSYDSIVETLIIQGTKIDFKKFKIVKYWFWGSLMMIWLSIFFGFFSTDIQTNGRGTMGKKWISYKGNILISIFFKVNLIKIKIENYLIINAKIIKSILHEYTNKIIKIKKPKLIIDNKKICGILQEVIVHKKENFLVTGIGINTKILPSNKHFKCTSLKDNSNKNINNKIIINKVSIIMIN